MIAQGTARTDEKGDAKITFETKTDDPRWRDQDLSYTIDADVKDVTAVISRVRWVMKGGKVVVDRTRKR